MSSRGYPPYIGHRKDKWEPWKFPFASLCPQKPPLGMSLGIRKEGHSLSSWFTHVSQAEEAAEAAGERESPGQRKGDQSGTARRVAAWSALVLCLGFHLSPSSMAAQWAPGGGSCPIPHTAREGWGGRSLKAVSDPRLSQLHGPRLAVTSLAPYPTCPAFLSHHRSCQSDHGHCVQLHGLCTAQFQEMPFTSTKEQKQLQESCSMVTCSPEPSLFLGDGRKNWTQGHALARQALCYWSHTLSSYVPSYMSHCWGRICLL